MGPGLPESRAPSSHAPESSAVGPPQPQWGGRGLQDLGCQGGCCEVLRAQAHEGLRGAPCWVRLLGCAAGHSAAGRLKQHKSCPHGSGGCRCETQASAGPVLLSLWPGHDNAVPRVCDLTSYMDTSPTGLRPMLMALLYLISSSKVQSPNTVTFRGIGVEDINI